MKFRHILCCAVLSAVASFAASAPAAVVVTGDVSPSDPATWGTNTTVFAGASGTGSVSLTAGSVVSTGQLIVGRDIVSNGLVSMDGSGTLWNVFFLTAGQGGTGAIKLSNGAQLICNASSPVIGSAGAGTINVDGAGSLLSTNFNITVAQSNSGTLNITGGGTVNCQAGNFGQSSANTSVARVNIAGAGSALNASAQVNIGSLCNTVMTLSGGGKITTTSLTIEPKGLLSMSVGDGSLITGAGGNQPATVSMANFGTVRFVAVPNLTAGTYSPVNTPFPINGTIQSIGGKWSDINHNFVVASPITGPTGQAVSLDLSQNQRLIISDPSGDTVQAAFQPTAVSSTLSMTANTLTSAQVTSLTATIPAGMRLLDGWTFTPTGYTAGNPVALSMKIGSGHALSDLSVWHFDGTTWTPYVPTDLSFDGTYASFTVTGFSGYAVTAVPEPASLAAFAGALCLLRRARRNA